MHFFLLQEAAQHADEAVSGGLLSPNGGVMVWTLVIFIVLLLVLSKYAFKPITKAVEEREKALADAIEAAQRDRDDANRLLRISASRLLRRGMRRRRSLPMLVLRPSRCAGS